MSNDDNSNDDRPPDNDDSDHQSDDFIVVAIGASAGGLAALRDLFEHLDTDTGMAFVVVQHLSPKRKSELTSILQRFSSMPVEVIEESTSMRPNHVYVIPPNTLLSVDGNTLHLMEATDQNRHQVTIDLFLESLAEAKAERAIAVILSGSRSDGARGVIDIKNRGGIAFVQLPEEAEFQSMPQSALDTGRVDLALPAVEIGTRLASIAHGERRLTEKAKNQKSAYRRIIARLRTTTGHDFSDYKRSTMLRRMARRLRLHGISDLEEYVEFLDDNDEEITALFEDVLITVTSFFRDPEAFEALAEKVIPTLVTQQSKERPIRIWVPACATGEEVYSIAILLWEEAQRHDVYPDFKIFATDIDRRSIEHARRGLYSQSQVQGLSSERQKRFFSAEAGAFKVTSELRDRILFADHDILRDPPFARLDLVSCRNLLIYMNREAKNRVFEVLHYALHSEGRLFLGNSEFLGDASELFTAVDPENRIYRPKHVDRPVLPHSTIVDSNGMRKLRRSDHSDTPGTVDRPRQRLGVEHHRLLIEQYAPPSVLVDNSKEIVHVAGDAYLYLRVPEGEPTSNLVKSAHPDLRLPLRAALIDALDRQSSTTTGELKFRLNDEDHHIRLIVHPVKSPTSDDMMAQVIFDPVDKRPALEPENVVDISEADPSLRKVVDQMERENEHLKRELLDTIERYESTTEELKTSNEELLTINEELQSTTEELETSQEELQSTNEELMTVNDELSDKVHQIDKANSDLKNLFASTNIGTIFLDRTLKISRFTKPVCNYFNILTADIGRPIEHITHQLKTDAMVDDATQVLKDLTPIEREVQSDDSRWFIIRTLPYRTLHDRIDGVVLTFFDITERKLAQDRLTENELLFRTTFENVSDGLFLFNFDGEQPGTFRKVNNSACERLGYSRTDLQTMTIKDIVDTSSIDIDAYLHTLREEGLAVADVKLRTSDGDLINEGINSRHFTVNEQSTVITVSRDITSRKAYEKALLTSKEESEQLAALRASFLANMSHEIRTPLTSIIGVSQLLEKRDLSGKQTQMVRLIQTSGRRLQQTLDSVLDISRIEAGEMQPRYREFDIVDQIRDDVEMLRPLAHRKGLTLEFSSPHDSYDFVTDAGFINRIVYNLTENGIKFTEEGGVTVEFKPADEAVELIVSDSGIGIDEEFLPHLFDKFKQASSGPSRSYEGSGLGMALVSHLVELLGGSLSVESQKGEGTVFFITIPEHSSDDEGDGNQSEDGSDYD